MRTQIPRLSVKNNCNNILHSKIIKKIEINIIKSYYPEVGKSHCVGVH